MFEINGKISTAVCCATNVESVAIEQIREMCSYEFSSGSKIRIIPVLRRCIDTKSQRYKLNPFLNGILTGFARSVTSILLFHG